MGVDKEEALLELERMDVQMTDSEETEAMEWTNDKDIEM